MSIPWMKDVDAAMLAARESNKALLLDFTAAPT
jgi:hypothetical protein